MPPHQLASKEDEAEKEKSHRNENCGEAVTAENEPSLKDPQEKEESVLSMHDVEVTHTNLKKVKVNLKKVKVPVQGRGKEVESKISNQEQTLSEQGLKRAGSSRKGEQRNKDLENNFRSGGGEKVNLKRCQIFGAVAEGSDLKVSKRTSMLGVGFKVADLDSHIIAGQVVCGALAGNKHKVKACGKCEGCLRVNCGLCMFCLDKPCFGGRNIRKQKCLERACTDPQTTRCEACL